MVDLIIGWVHLEDQAIPWSIVQQLRENLLRTLIDERNVELLSIVYDGWGLSSWRVNSNESIGCGQSHKPSSQSYGIYTDLSGITGL